MTYRTTFALDKETRLRLKKLSARWHVSQAEVVRRALSQAEEHEQGGGAESASRLRELYASGRGIAREAGEKYLAEVRNNRKRWRGE